MKKSELKIIGDYRLSPDAWGDQYIMIDEQECSAELAEVFKIPVEQCDPDRHENSHPEHVQLAVDSNGNHFVLGTGANDGAFRPCESLSDARRGSIGFTSCSWEKFDEED